MKYGIITISREYGSGGKAIGKMLAQKLNIPCYDSEIIEKVAEESGFAKEYIADKGEYASGGYFSSLFRSSAYYHQSNEDIIWSIQTKTIRELAEKGPCIIVGRCADYILKDRDDVFSVFISAEPEARIKRITEIYGDTGQDLEKVIKDRDKRRSSYYQYYTELEWGKASNYGICLSSSALGFEKCAEILYDLCK